MNLKLRMVKFCNFRLEFQAKNRHEAGSLLHTNLLLALLFIPEDEGIRSFETSIDLYLTKRRSIPKDITIHSHHCETLKTIHCSINTTVQNINFK